MKKITLFLAILFLPVFSGATRNVSQSSDVTLEVSSTTVVLVQPVNTKSEMRIFWQGEVPIEFVLEPKGSNLRVIRTGKAPKVTKHIHFIALTSDDLSRFKQGTDFPNGGLNWKGLGVALSIIPFTPTQVLYVQSRNSEPLLIYQPGKTTPEQVSPK